MSTAAQRAGSVMDRTTMAWSDGLHYVRHASIKDRHPMKFIVDMHRVPDITRSAGLRRRFHTQEEAIAYAADLTARRCQEDEKVVAYIGDQATSSMHIGKARRPKQERRKKDQPAFALTHFDCIRANSVAQVWQCTSMVGAKGTPGRRSKAGKAAQPTMIPHQVGECAVMMGDEPVRHPDDGHVRIFKRWQDAEEFAEELYQDTPEDERFPSKGKLVYAVGRVQVIFDPEANGSQRPFSLYLPDYRRPVFEDRTVALPFVEKHVDEEIEVAAKKLHRQLNRTPSFREVPLRFRTINGAIEEATKRERMLG